MGGWGVEWGKTTVGERIINGVKFTPAFEDFAIF